MNRKNREIIEKLVLEEGIQTIDLEQVGYIKPEVLGLIPDEIALRYKLIPIAQEEDSIAIATSNPFDLDVLDTVYSLSHAEPKIYFAPADEVEKFLSKLYMKHDVFTELGDEVAEGGDADDPYSVSALEESEDEAPAIRIVDSILLNAIQERASDIHIEPQEDRLNIFYRIDGVLREAGAYPRRYFNGVVSRIKILSSLDIAEKRLPQDGRSKIKIFGRDIDIRVSTLPTITGEKVVLRILDRDLHSLNIADLGLEPKLQELFKQSLQAPHGMILVTGPTGSGKTTTLYSALNYVNAKEKNIITVEDPVEYRLKGINQVQAHAEIGLTFSAGLRSILRQDPDIIMVGEIRDQETAEIALRASLTGHLVFSTLHTNSSIATIMRLIDMGIDAFLICSSVHLIVAQRLVRRICLHCSDETEPEPHLLARFEKDGDLLQNATFYQGRGCPNCSGTGYWGRVAVFELLPLTNRLRSLIMDNANMEEIRSQALEDGMETLQRNGLKKVINGMTTLEEVMRISSDSF